ncbi:MAG: DUF1385 domain-containing protein [Armatimonadota bacterium]
MSDQEHYYGGQAILEGVMMRGQDKWAAAVRREDDKIVVTKHPTGDFADRHGWAKWPLIRGNVALVDTLGLGVRSLIFSFNVLVEEQQEKENPTDNPGQTAEESADTPNPDTKTSDEPQSDSQPTQQPEDSERIHVDAGEKKQSSSGWMVWLSLIPAFAIGIGLFVLLPAWVPDLFRSQFSELGLNVVEAVARITAILGYIVVISFMPDIRRVFQYHGAEHTVINCFEAGETVTTEKCSAFGPLHPRCGTTFLLMFVVVKLLLNAPLGWPEPLLRMGLRLLMVIPAAAISYEILRFSGRHRDTWFGRLMSYPGLWTQKLTTRKPNEKQLETAIYALAAVADEVDLPEDLPEPYRADLDGQIEEQDPAIPEPEKQPAEEPA